MTTPAISSFRSRESGGMRRGGGADGWEVLRGARGFGAGLFVCLLVGSLVDLLAGGFADLPRGVFGAGDFFREEDVFAVEANVLDEADLRAMR